MATEVSIAHSPPMSESAYADYRVHQQALKQADQFLAKVSDLPNEDERLQLCILDFLRFRSEFVSDEYVSTEDIAKHLANSGFQGLGDQKIRSSGIAKLRDSEVIIASATKGYKIPRSRADINDFLELASSQILPLLDRVKKARDVYRLSSVGSTTFWQKTDSPRSGSCSYRLRHCRFGIYGAAGRVTGVLMIAPSLTSMFNSPSIFCLISAMSSGDRSC